MKPIRILHMIGSMDIGGSQTMILNLYRAIDRNVIQMDFVLDHPEEHALAEQFEKMGARVHVVPSFRGSNILQVQKAWHTLFRNHPEYKTLHAHVRSYASIYLPIAKKYGVKTIIHSHSTSNGHGIKAMVKAMLQYPLRYQADYFFSCSKAAGKWLFGKRVASSQKHMVLKNAIDAERYAFCGKVREDFREKLDLNGKRVYIHVGRFHPAKNHSFLISVFRRIHDTQKNAVLLLVGDGELRADIVCQIRDLGLDKAVMLLGNRNDVPELLQAADVFLLPSAWEGLGIVAVEAQAADLPCLCSDAVPREVSITPKCRFLPLEEDAWIKAALHTNDARKDTMDSIVAAGYDVQSTARWLQDFYLKI